MVIICIVLVVPECSAEAEEKRNMYGAVIKEMPELYYTGEPIYPDFELWYKDELLQKNTDYRITGYSNNINAGLMEVSVAGCGRYEGDYFYHFVINPRTIHGLKDTLKRKDGKVYQALYTGKEIKPKTIFRLPIIVDGKTEYLTPKEGKDYTVEYKNNTKIGTAYIEYSFYGNYQGLITKEFHIIPDKVTKLSIKRKGKKMLLTWKRVKGASGYEIYRAANKNGVYKRIASIGRKTQYTDRKRKGKAYYKVCAFGRQNGKRYYGNESVTRTGTTRLSRVGIDEADVQENDIIDWRSAFVHTKFKDDIFPEQTYSGRQLRPEPQVWCDGTLLKRGTDYEIEYGDNINAGIGSYTIIGLGRHVGSIRTDFAIGQRKVELSNPKLVNRAGTVYKATYTGKSIKPKVEFRIPIEYEGERVYLYPKEGKDYIASYSSNQNIGTAYVNYIFINNYTGVVSKWFEIVPGKVSGFSVKKKKNKNNLTWKKVKGATAYEISWSAKKNTGYKRVAFVKKKTKYVDRKKRKKGYYRIQACAKADDGKWMIGNPVVLRIK